MLETVRKVESWAADKNLLDSERSHAQMLKMTEEVGELAGGIAKNKPDVIKDSIGDCVVVLTILARQCGFTIEECFESAYNEIKSRTGKTVNGVFVKDEPSSTQEWIVWYGGKCPVPENTLVDLKMGGKDINRAEIWGKMTAGNMDWNHDYTNCKILAYRVVK